MATRKAKAPAAPAAQSREEAARLVGRIGEIQRELSRREADLGDALARAKEAAEATALPLKEELLAAQAAVQAWCEAHRYEITGGNKVKYCDLTTGRVLWRFRPPKVTLRGVDNILAWLIKNKKADFLRTKVEIDKEAMLKDVASAKAVPGVSIGSEGEDFVIEPHEAQLVEAAA